MNIFKERENYQDQIRIFRLYVFQSFCKLYFIQTIILLLSIFIVQIDVLLNIREYFHTSMFLKEYPEFFEIFNKFTKRNGTVTIKITLIILLFLKNYNILFFY